MRFGCPSNHNTRKHKFTEPAEDPQAPQTRNPKSTPALQEKPDAVKVVGILLIAHSIKEDADFVILGSREQEFSNFQNRVPIGMLGFSKSRNSIALQNALGSLNMFSGVSRLQRRHSQKSNHTSRNFVSPTSTFRDYRTTHWIFSAAKPLDLR